MEVSESEFIYRPNFLHAQLIPLGYLTFKPRDAAVAYI